MGSEEHAIVCIGSGIGEDRLIGRTHPVERFADILQVDLACAKESIEVEHHSSDPVVLGRSIECTNDVAGLMFADRGATRQEGIEEIYGCAFLDNDTVEFEQERSFADLGRAGAGGQDGEKQREEEQHEQQDEAVLDTNEQAPDLACKMHGNSSPVMS